MLVRPSLSNRLQPVTFEVSLPDKAALALDEAETELLEAASNDPNKCMGHFPGLVNVSDEELPDGMSLEEICHDFPACDRLALVWPQLRGLTYNFLRLAMTKQTGSEDTFHLDRGSDSAVTGRTEGVLVWRGLGNVSKKTSRTLEYLDRSPLPSDLLENQYLGPGEYSPSLIRSVTLEPRLDNVVQFVIFASNSVWHTGGVNEHFVIGFGREEYIGE